MTALPRRGLGISERLRHAVAGRGRMRMIASGCALPMAVLCMAAAPPSFGDPLFYKLLCRSKALTQPVGDVDGHTVSASEYTCDVEDGPFAGAKLSGTNYFEYVGTRGRLIGGHSVLWKPGMALVRQHREATAWYKPGDDGRKVVSFGGEGSGVYVFASGSAAKYAGTRYSYSYQSTNLAPGEFALLVRHEP